MTRDGNRARPGGGLPTPLDVEALTVAMTLAPGVYSRNRLYDLFDASPARAARRRAAVLRGLARQLSGGTDVELMATPKPEGGWSVTYRIARLHLTRSLELSDVERAVLVHLTAPSGPSLLPTTPHDRALVDGALERLAPPFAEGARRASAEGQGDSRPPSALR